jgi:hypothetical protein
VPPAQHDIILSRSVVVHLAIGFFCAVLVLMIAARQGNMSAQLRTPRNDQSTLSRVLLDASILVKVSFISGVVRAFLRKSKSNSCWERWRILVLLSVCLGESQNILGPCGKKIEKWMGYSSCSKPRPRGILTFIPSLCFFCA